MCNFQAKSHLGDCICPLSENYKRNVVFLEIFSPLKKIRKLKTASSPTLRHDVSEEFLGLSISLLIRTLGERLWVFHLNNTIPNWFASLMKHMHDFCGETTSYWRLSRVVIVNANTRLHRRGPHPMGGGRDSA